MKAKQLFLVAMALVMSVASVRANDLAEQKEASYEYSGTLFVSLIPFFNKAVYAEFNSTNTQVDLSISEISVLGYNLGEINLYNLNVNASGTITTPSTTVDVAGLGTYPVTISNSSVTSQSCTLTLVIQGTPTGNISVNYYGTVK